MAEISFYIDDEDLDRIFALKDEEGLTDLTANDYAKELLIRKVHSLYPSKVQTDDNGTIIPRVKVDGFRFKHSNTEKTYITEDGKKRTYKVCDICGAEQQNSFGCEIDYARAGNNGSYRICLCGKCANRILPTLEEAIDKMHTLMDEQRAKTQ